MPLRPDPGLPSTAPSDQRSDQAVSRQSRLARQVPSERRSARSLAKLVVAVRTVGRRGSYVSGVRVALSAVEATARASQSWGESPAGTWWDWRTGQRE